jgi:inositol oxygenase
MSWGHDEYLYHIMKPYLPEPALYMIRYHSFYAAHRERDYEHLMTAHDRAMFDWVRAFNPYDLYSKSPTPPQLSELRPHYDKLLTKYLPAELRF